MVKETKERSKNRYYVMLLTVMVIAYGLFFTSKAWFPTKDNLVDATPLYQSLKYDTYTLYLTSWDYAAKDQSMEITIELQNSEVLDQSLIYTAVERSYGDLKVTPVLSDSKYVVLRIDDINPKWQDISLRISSKQSSNSTLKIYMNKETVTNVKALPKKTKTEYQKKRLQLLIAYNDSQIKKNTDSINDLNNENTKLETKIEELQKTEYLTEDDIQDNQDLISKAGKEMSDNQDTISKSREEIDNLNANTAKIKEQIQAIQ